MLPGTSTAVRLLKLSGIRLTHIGAKQPPIAEFVILQCRAHAINSDNTDLALVRTFWIIQNWGLQC